MSRDYSKTGPRRSKPQVTTIPEPDPDAEAEKLCEINKCKGPGLYRAPVSPDKLDSHYWFCLDHVREYNKAWNFCLGKNEDQIEHLIREDVVGWRPTWPLGKLGKNFSQAQFDQFDQMRDQFGLFKKGKRAKQKRKENQEKTAENGGNLGKNEQDSLAEALDIFELSPPITAAGVKTQYKKLAKQHHPDANGGDEAAEERLKLINRAYATLKKQFGP